MQAIKNQLLALKEDNTTEPPPEPSICPADYFTYYGTGTLDELLQSGDKDVGVSDGDKHQVVELQSYLEALGIDIGSTGADGWYGEDTMNAVISYQNTHGLIPSGEIDIETQSHINNSCSTDTNSTTGGGGESNFDFTTACSITDLPEPLPEELSTNINTIIEEAGDTIAAAVVCPLMQTAVTAYNLTNGGGLPGGIGIL